MTSIDDYSTLVRILRRCDSIQWDCDNRSPKGNLTITEDIIECLQRLMEKSLVTECRREEVSLGADSSIVPNLVGQFLSLEFLLPVPNDEYALVRNLDSLLEYSRYLYQVPSNIYLIESSSNEIPHKYKDAVAFAQLLKITADHSSEEGNILTCFFYDGVKITVPIRYVEQDIAILDNLEELTHSFQSPRLKERIQIFKSSLVKSAISAPSESQLFPHLIANFLCIRSSFEQDWNLYVSDFSMDEVLNDLEEKILKIAENLTSTLSDLQKTMIAIPLAIIFAAPRINTNDIQTWNNGLIVASVWLFGMFTWTFFINHKRALRFIINEIEETEQFVQDKHHDIAEKINSKFKALRKRCDYQNDYRRAVGSLMWLAVILVSVFFFSPQLFPLVKGCYGSFNEWFWHTDLIIYLHGILSNTTSSQ